MCPPQERQAKLPKGQASPETATSSWYKNLYDLRRWSLINALGYFQNTSASKNCLLRSNTAGILKCAWCFQPPPKLLRQHQNLEHGCHNVTLPRAKKTILLPNNLPWVFFFYAKKWLQWLQKSLIRRDKTGKTNCHFILKMLTPLNFVVDFKTLILP